MSRALLFPKGNSFSVSLGHVLVPHKKKYVTSLWPQHSDSEGTLAAEKQPLQATSSVSSLGLCESSAGKPVAREEYSPSLRGRLVQDNGDEPEGEESDSDDILMEDNQVADFASSMLAAISCWHYRARALLSMDFTTVRFSATKGILDIPWPDLQLDLHVCQTSLPCCMCSHRIPQSTNRSYKQKLTL